MAVTGGARWGALATARLVEALRIIWRRLEILDVRLWKAGEAAGEKNGCAATRRESKSCLRSMVVRLARTPRFR